MRLRSCAVTCGSRTGIRSRAAGKVPRARSTNCICQIQYDRGVKDRTTVFRDDGEIGEAREIFRALAWHGQLDDGAHTDWQRLTGKPHALLSQVHHLVDPF